MRLPRIALMSLSMMLTASAAMAAPPPTPPVGDDVLMAVRFGRGGGYLLQDTAASGDSCVAKAVRLMSSELASNEDTSMIGVCSRRADGVPIRTVRCDGQEYSRSQQRPLTVSCTVSAPENATTTVDGRPFP